MPDATTTEALKRALRGRGLRATAARIVVMRVLGAAARPLSHAEVTALLSEDEWDRATVYRNLIDLVEAGLVRRSDHGDHVWRFELRRAEHGSGGAHAHFVCTGCGIMECLPTGAVGIRRAAPPALRNRRVEVEVRGVCDRCT